MNGRSVGRETVGSVKMIEITFWLVRDGTFYR